MAGYETPTSGEILLDGKNIRGPNKDRMVVFQETALFPWMTNMENVLYGPRVQGERSEAEYRKHAEELMELVGLQDFHDKYSTQLSGGMQRRAELARALIIDLPARISQQSCDPTIPISTIQSDQFDYAI